MDTLLTRSSSASTGMRVMRKASASSTDSAPPASTRSTLKSVKRPMTPSATWSTIVVTRTVFVKLRSRR